MIKCPKCEKSVLQVSGEIVYVQSVEFENKKIGKGVKKKKIKNNGVEPVELRVFLNCSNINCDYSTENLQSINLNRDYPELIPYTNEISLIIEQVDSMSFSTK